MGKRTNTAKWTGKNWRIDVQRDGQRRSFYSSMPGRKGQREANSKADAWLDEGIEAKGQRVADLYSQWLDEIQRTTGSGNYTNIESRWRNWVKPAIGHKRITALTEQDLQNIINNATSEGKSRKTLQSLAADLRAFCKYCRLCKASTLFPENLRIPSSARYKGKTILQPAELLILFNTDTSLYKGKVVKEEYIHAFRFQAVTGLRPGELIGLTWADVDGHVVRVRRAINVNGEETQGKNQNALRSFVMSDMARDILDAQHELTGDEESVFGITREKTYYNHWQVYCKTNGITPISLYELRHTFISIVKNLPAGTVKPLVGHSENMDTFGVYGHLLDGENENTAKAVNNIFTQILINA